jgi:signal transduction histidine kinase
MEGLSTDHVWTIHEDDEGLIWAGGERGLNLIDPKGAITSFITENGLPDNEINSILSDDLGNLWVGHNHGIYRVSKQELKDLVGRHISQLHAVSYDEVDGMSSSETNGELSSPSAVKTSYGHLLFATTKGIAVVDPKRLLEPEPAPLPVIEQVLVDGQDVKTIAADVRRLTYSSPQTSRGVDLKENQSLLTSTAIRLEAGRGRVLQFHYTGCSFIAPERLRFQYKLEGYDKDWRDAGTRRVAYYSNLSPRDYTFRLRAGNHHDVWNLAGTSFGFSITPYLWQRYSFWAAISLLMGGSICGFHRYRLAHHRQIERLQGDLALATERDRIAKDLHDGAGAALTELRLLSALAEQHHRNPNRIEQTVKSIAATTNRLQASLREIIWMARPESQTLEGLLSRACEQAESLAHPSGIACSFDIPDDLPALSLGPDRSQNLDLAIKEALNNAVKHSDATKLQIIARVAESIVSIVIKDDGKGFNPAAARSSNHGLGLVTMQERLEKIGGRFEIVSNHGTIIRFEIPLPGSKSD